MADDPQDGVHRRRSGFLDVVDINSRIVVGG